LIIKIGFEWKDAERQIEPARHFLDPAAVPGPDLRADVINNFRFIRRSLGEGGPERARESQIKSRIIDQHDGVRFSPRNLAQRLVELLSKVTVMPDHFPKPQDARLL